MSTLKSKIRGALYAAAIGDAMGATTEFMTSEEIQKRYGVLEDIVGGGWLHINRGDITDDTQMSLCVMKALMESDCKLQFEDLCKKNFINWYNSGPIDVGNQCSESIRRLKRGLSIPVDSDALGNGSLMRALPCALIPNGWELNTIQGRLTHNNSVCDSFIYLYTEFIQNLLKGKDPIFSSLLELSDPTGYVVDTYINACYYLMSSESLEEGLIKVVNDGGDADTIGSIAGGLLGAKFGFEAIPERWVEALNEDVKKQLDIFVDYCVKEWEKNNEEV